MLAIKRDQEIDQLLSGVTIAQGGVCPKTHSQLLPNQKRVRGTSQPDETSSTQSENHRLFNDSLVVNRRNKENKSKIKASRMEIDENEE